MPKYRFEFHGPTDAELVDACGFAVVGEPPTPLVSRVYFLADSEGLSSLIERKAYHGWKFVEEVPETP